MQAIIFLSKQMDLADGLFVSKWVGNIQYADSDGKYAVVVTNQYDHKWYNEYLRKESGCTVLHDFYDFEAVGALFPTMEQQAEYQQTKGKTPLNSAVVAHCDAWVTSGDPPTLQGALYYLRSRMFFNQDLQIIMDERRLRQLALAIYRYRTKNAEPSMEDDEWCSRTDPVRGAVYCHMEHCAIEPSADNRI